jgi:hypothetical protein
MIKPLVLILAIFVSLIFFQNCADVHIAPPSEVMQASSADTYFKATACPKAELLPGESTKFIFVVDMSVSNIGSWKKIPVPGKPGKFWSYFEKEKNTDLEGARFEAIKSFLESCGSMAGNQFAVLAFSSTAGAIRTVNGARSFQCDGVFGSKDSAIASINELKAIQDGEFPMYERWRDRPVTSAFVPGLLGGTNYGAGLACVENMIVNDLTNPVTAAQAKNYQVFFISDGAPKDGVGTGCEADKTFTDDQRHACYQQGIESTVSFAMQAAIGNQKNIKYHALYYNQNKEDTADDELIRKYMGLISRLGDTGEPIFLGRFSESLADGKNPLCELLGIRGSIEYRPDVMTLVNLSAKRVNGKLESDSDIDGLSDEEEALLGYDPVNRRSQVVDVLDGICQRVGGTEACAQMRGQIICDSAENSMGLTGCDLKMLQIDQLYAHPTVGMDSDKDGMPDLIEILKGTDAGLSDMHLDPDGDGTSNRVEILQNRDPFISDAGVHALERPSFQVNYLGKQEGACPYGAWQMTSNTLPGVLGLSFSSDSVNLNHSDRENVYLIYYRSNPSNSAKKAIEFHSYFLKVDYERKSQNELAVTPAKTEIVPDDFSKSGEVEP